MKMLMDDGNGMNDRVVDELIEDECQRHPNLPSFEVGSVNDLEARTRQCPYCYDFDGVVRVSDDPFP